MATSGRPPISFSFEAPAHVSASTGANLTWSAMNNLCKYMSNDLYFFNQHLKKSKKWKCVAVSKISHFNKQISLSFVLNTDKELEEFYKACKYNVLSKILTDYSMDNSFQLHAGLDLYSMLKFDIMMDEATYKQAKSVLNPEEKYKGDTHKKQDESVPPPLQSHPGLKEIKITTQSQEDVVRKEVILVQPSLESGKKLHSISLMLQDMRNPGGVEIIDMQRRSDSLWIANFAVPLNTPIEELKCWFSAVVASSSYVVFTKYETIESECRYNILHDNVQRVLWSRWAYWDKTVNQRDITEHYKDIVFRCNNSHLRDCIMQIESLHKQYVLEGNSAVSVFRNVFCLIDAKNSRHQLLIFVMLGNLFSNTSYVDERILKDIEKTNMIATLKCFRVTDLTQSCSKFMLRLAIELFKSAQRNKDYNFIAFVCATYPFFDAKQLSEKLIEIVRRREPLVPNNIDMKTESEILHLFRRMLGDLKDSNMQLLINQLLRQLPARLGVKVYLALKDKAEKEPELTEQSSVQTMFYDTLMGSLTAYLKSTQSTCVELLEMWKTIKHCPELVELNVTEFENAMLQKINKGSVPELQILKDILLEVELFESFSQQTELIKTLKDVKTVKLQCQLFEIISTRKFEEAGQKADTKWFVGCFENAFTYFQKGISIELKLKEVYIYLSKTYKVPFVANSDELCEILNTSVVEFLRHCDLKKLLRTTKDVEEIMEKDPRIGQLFRVHMQKLLEHQATTSLYQVLKSCETAGELRINSRVTADIVCTIMDLAELGRESSVPDQFLNLIAQCELWNSVLKARGREVSKVEQCRSYIEATHCINKMLHLIQNGEIHYGYLKQLTKKKDKKDIIDILFIKSALTKTQLSRQWDEIVEYFQAEVNNVSCSVSVLNTIQSQISRKHIPSGIKELLSDLEVLKQNIEKGHLTAIQLKENITTCVYLSDLWEKCSFLKHYVKSKIFWNSCKEVVETEFEDLRNHHKEDTKKETAESSICASEPIEACETIDANETVEACETVEASETFESNETVKACGAVEANKTVEATVEACTDTSDFSYPETFLLLQILTKDGISEYKNAWNSLIHEHGKEVTFALKLLEGSEVGKEIKYVEYILSEPIPTDVKTTLHLLEDIHSYEYIVASVRKSLEVFDVTLDDEDVLSKAIDAFDKIRTSASGSCPFSLVITSLKLVKSMSKELSSESVDILHALSESLSLVEFLKQIVEEDIRNLIDAVEDISEQYVQESTVSALIEVKSFLQAILDRSIKEGLNASEFIGNLNEQTKQLSSSASKLLPAKIHECMSSLHNLKSLYGNVANRGEITAEIIGNIISKGEFKFELKKYGVCDFSAIYRSGGSREETQMKQVLTDLRSRALLLMNTRSKTHDRKITSEDLEDFVMYIDICNEIAELCEELHQSGNVEFLSYTTTSDCNGLAPLRKMLHEKTTKWTTSLYNLREKYYLLNFIHGPEIHILHDFFEGNTGFENIATILRFIHPDIPLSTLLEEYRRLKSEEAIWSIEIMLECFGKTLHFGYKGKKPVERKFQRHISSKKVTDVVQNRKLFVAALDESSNQVVKTLLSLYHNTTQTLPEPHQVLICTHDTTWNELELLLKRCFGAYKFTRVQQLFCISNIELLTNELQFRLVEELKNINTQDKYLLSMICRGSSKHPFLDELSSFTSKSVTTLSDEAARQAFQNECPGVVTFTSASPGLGKSKLIKTNAFLSKKQITKIHISGPLNKKKIIERLSDAKIQIDQALHIDVGSVDDPVELDTFIFELIILRYVTAGFRATGLDTNCVYIEIANTINDSLRNSLNTVMSFKREHLVWDDYNDFIVSMEINSPVQVVCHYLQCLNSGKLDKKDIFFSGNNCETPLEPFICRKLLREYFPGDSSASFSIVNIFLYVLADQLKKMACSSYFRVSRVSEMVGHKTIPTVRSTLVAALVEASKEFASRSIKICRSTQLSTTGAGEDFQDLKPVQLSDLLKQRVDGMIRWEDSNHLIFVFHNQNIQTLSPLYREVRIVPGHIKTLFESQMKRALQNFKQMNQTELQSLLQKVARTDPQPLSADKINILNSEYALTPDNLLKMVLIMLRVKSHIPVIVMGETGCGKTSLIRYLATVSDVDFEVLPIHSGIEENMILDVINQNNEKALISPQKELWLFLDEINTSEHIGVMNDAISSRSCLGKELATNLVVMGACNPYKLRTETAISTAGLKGKIKTDELSKLVYRVLPLPERMVDYVWDFGSLSDTDESVYIRRMIDDVFRADNKMLELLQDVLSASQKFVRQKEEVSYCVSLRDVQRCKMLVKWFLNILYRRGDLSRCAVEERSIILALAICYHSRFASISLRESYRKELGQMFSKHGLGWYHANCILNVIVEEQRDIINRMELPVGTAKNSALQENVFVILNCLLNRIPVFLVGKPGCSKSLSMQVIRSNLRGKDSKDRFFKTLPQLYCVSFQGSESSTSDGIIKVFEKAIRYQKSNNEDDVLSVVILDEIGLAEVSKYNPLKVLHSLLEPEGRPQPDVAVVGISNWSLDASKMNRGIHLSRPDMDEQELYQTGVSISESLLESKFQNRSRLFSSGQLKLSNEALNDVLKDIAKSYLQYTEKLRYKNFHGLRDFYSLAKFVSKQIIEEDEGSDNVAERDKEKIVFEGLQRNFGGLPTESATLLKMFQIRIQDETFETTNVLKLMKDNIGDKLARHLMCITSGESAMSLIENLLVDMGREERVVIFGSHFEEDQTADYNYRILSRIILCMEQGYVLILRDLENVYGSLYDMLNQNYTIIGKKKHCRVALGHYSNPICHVHDDFRCIVLVDENKVDVSDPPFLNRFEKQYLKFADIVSSTESSLIEKLEEWVDQFCGVEGCHFDARDCFPIYSKDMIPSLVLKMYQAAKDSQAVETDEILEMSKTKLLYIAQPDAVFRIGKCTSDEIRAETGLIKKEFLSLPVHLGIWNFIDIQTGRQDDKLKGLMTVVLTNSSIHVRNIEKELEYHVQVEKLSAFKSEKQLSLRIQHFWIESTAAILFLHCSVAEDEKHIPLAKSTVENLRLDALKEHSELTKRVYLILHLDRRRTETKAVPPINFLSGWEIVTLDSIEEPTIPLYELSSMSLYSTVTRKRPLTKYIVEQLFWSFTRIKFHRLGRDIDSILRTIEQMKESERLLDILEDLICEWIDSESNNLYQFDWLEQIAADAKTLNENSTFMLALEQKVTSVINIPLSKLLFQLENMNALASYFCDDRYESQRKLVWKDMIHDESVFTIKDIPDESGPECYLCTAADLCLKMPISKIIFDKIEGTKDDFMDSFLFVKGNLDLEEEDIMPQEVLEVLFSQHESLIKDAIPDIQAYMYDNIGDDYFHDFSNFVSHVTRSRIQQEKRIEIMIWILSHKIHLQTKNPIELFVKLHATFWILSSVIDAEYQLFLSCAEVFNVEENFIDFIENQVPENTHVYSKDRPDSDDEIHTPNMSVEISTDYQNGSRDNLDDGDFQFSQPRDVDVYADSNENAVIQLDCLPAGSTAVSDSDLNKEKVKLHMDDEEVSLEDVENVSTSGDDGNECNKSADLEEGSTAISDSDLNEEKVKLHMDDKEVSLEDVENMSTSGDDGNECNKSADLEEGFPSEMDEKHVANQKTTAFGVSEPYYDVEEAGTMSQSYTSVTTSMFNNENMEDASETLVEYISQKLLPTSACLDMFKTFENWNNRVSSVITLARQISSEPNSFHALRFCQDVVCILHLTHEDNKCHAILKLASILQSNKDQTLDSAECYDCVCEIVLSEPRPSVIEAHYMIAAYLNRCLEADESSQVMMYFLKMMEEQKLSDDNMIAFKPPMQTALLLEKVEPHTDIFHKLVCAGDTDSKDTCIDLTEQPFLLALDETLKSFGGTLKVDSQFATLVIDILESFFMDFFSECTVQEAENEIHSLLSAHRIIVSEEYGFCFLNAVAYYKAFIMAFAQFARDSMLIPLEYQSLIDGIQAVMGENKDCPMTSVFLKQYLLNEIGRDMLPWKFRKLCESMEDRIEVFQTIEWMDSYPTSCLEGNPLLLYIGTDCKIVEAALSETDAATQESLLQNILKKSDDEKVILSLHAVILGWFYVARSYKQQDDTYNQLARTIQDIAIHGRMDSSNLDLLSRLLGIQEFLEFSDLDLKEGSSEIQVVIAVFCTSLFSLVLSSNQQSRCRHLSFLAKCLLEPTQLKSDFMISLNTMLNQERETLTLVDKFISCPCGYRFASKDANLEEPFHCPICEKEIKLQRCYSVDVEQPQKVAIHESESFTSLQPLTAKLIDLFVHACFKGSVALNFSSVKDMEAVLELSEIDNIPEALTDRVETCFHDVMTLLDMKHRDTYLFLQACLYHLRNFVCNDKKSCDTQTEFNTWSQEFEQHIQPLAFDRYETVLGTVRKYVNLTKAPVNTLELSVGEHNDINLDSGRRIEVYPSLFRLQGQPSLSSLKHEVDILKTGQDHPYPFLAFVLKVLPELEITEHVLPLIQWHLTTVTHTGYRMKKHECLEMSVKDFIHHSQSTQVQELLGKRFKRFQEAWSYLTESKAVLQTRITRLTNLSKMKDCLLLDNESPMYKVLKELANIQNNFLDSTLQIGVRNNCQALKCLFRASGTVAIPFKYVWDVKKSSIISYHWDNSLLQFSQADLRYGYGRHIKYEFEAIEKSLALDLVVTKCHLLLDESLPCVVFVDEFYKGYATLVKEICIIIPQKPLPSEMIRKVKRKGEENSGLTAELITHVGILTALAKKTKGSPEQPIIEFVEMWKNVLTLQLPLELLPAPENSVKLCHLVALYGLLEELNAEPIESLNDKYREPLRRDIEADLHNILKTNKKIAEMILKATKRFSYRCLYTGEVDCTRPLAEYLEDDSFWPLDQSGLLRLPTINEKLNVVEQIPTDLKVQHVYEMITFLEEKLTKLTEKEVKLTQIASTFKSQGTVTKPDRKKKITKGRRV